MHAPNRNITPEERIVRDVIEEHFDEAASRGEHQILA